VPMPPSGRGCHSEFHRRKSDALITFGIKPTFPSTQLVYQVRRSTELSEMPEHRLFVEAFREKPDLETAKQYVDKR